MGHKNKFSTGVCELSSGSGTGSGFVKFFRYGIPKIPGFSGQDLILAIIVNFMKKNWIFLKIILICLLFRCLSKISMKVSQF